MDSLNSPNVQNIEINSKSTGSNTAPISCASCGSKHYVEGFWQPPCFKAIYPSTSSNKKSSENKEEGFIFQQPLFSSPSFFPSFFNGSLPQNFFFANSINSNTNLNHITAPEKKHKEIQEQISPPFGVSFHQTEKPDFGFNDLTNPLKSSCISEPSENIQNPKENSQKSVVQRCACNNVLPWTCSPFIIPIFSYCVLWNSQTYNSNFPASNIFCTHHENEIQKESEHNQKEESNVKHRTFEKNVDHEENVAGDVKKENQNEYWRGEKSRRNEWKVSTHKDGSDSSFLSLNSINYTEEGGYELEKKLESENLLKNSSQESNLEKILSQEEVLEEKHDEEQSKTENENVSVENSDNEESTTLDKPDPNEDTPVDPDSESITSTVVNSETPSEFEVIKSKEHGDEGLVGEASDQLIGQSDSEELRVLTSGFIEPNPTDRSSIKKPIKNFTVTDQIMNTVQGEEAIAMTVAAAGDLGGAQCTGYKVSLPLSETELQEKMKEDTQTEERLDLKDSNEDDVISLQESKDSKNQTKNDKSCILKAQQKPNSGIAKLSNNKKEGTELSQNTKQEDNKKQKVMTLVKKKHNCIGTEKSGNILKNQKTKLSPKFHELQGSDRQSVKSTADKTSSNKREDKDRVRTVRTQTHKKSSNLK